MIDQELLKSISSATITAAHDDPFSGVATSSKDVQQGSLFFALVGARDGHAYLDDAIRGGATGVVVSTDVPPPVGVVTVRVPDTLVALQELSKGVRAQYDVDAIAITGSVGKTTTKNLIAHVIGATSTVLSSPKSFNNHIGVPLTLLSLDPAHEGLIAEIGTNHPGEIRALADLVKPRTALVTNIGYAHVGNFGSREALADEKASIFEAVAPDGVWFVNADDPLLNDAVGRLDRPGSTRIVTFGCAPAADVRVSELVVTEGGTSGLVSVGGESRHFTIPLVGRHFATTVAGTIAVAVERGVSLATAVDRLGSFAGTEGRASMSTVRDGSVLLIDDTYNGSPDSMIAALDTLATFSGRRRIAVLGEMRELGDWSTTLHETVGAKVTESADELVFMGPSEVIVRAAATTAGMDPSRIHSAASAVEAGAIVERLLDAAPGAPAAVLVKGSRFVHAERVPLMMRGVPVRCSLELCDLYIHCSRCPKLLGEGPAPTSG